MLAAKKRFGQNFLHDVQVIDRIVSAIAPQADDTVVEIGPGRGALTYPLLQFAQKLTAIEIDRDLIAHLQRQAPRYGALTLHEGDALDFDFATLITGSQHKLRLVGNLPYNISTPLLFHLLTFAPHIQDMHFMLQKEVVERLCAEPNSKDYGRLTVSMAAHCDAQMLFTLGPEAFTPAPKVDSAIVRLVPRTPDFVINNPQRFDLVVKTAFAQRRKMLGKALETIIDRKAWSAIGIDATRRAETLSPAEFAVIANAT